MFLALFASSAFSASLSGSVVDESGEPLSGLTVYAVDHRLAYASAMTSSDGSWGIENLPEGAYRRQPVSANAVVQTRLYDWGVVILLGCCKHFPSSSSAQ